MTGPRYNTGRNPPRRRMDPDALAASMLIQAPSAEALAARKAMAAHQAASQIPAEHVFPRELEARLRELDQAPSPPPRPPPVEVQPHPPEVGDPVLLVAALREHYRDACRLLAAEAPYDAIACRAPSMWVTGFGVCAQLALLRAGFALVEPEAGP
jgi:hypothetical protein